MRLLLFELVSSAAAARHEGAPPGVRSACSAVCLSQTSFMAQWGCAACSRAMLVMMLYTLRCCHWYDLPLGSRARCVNGAWEGKAGAAYAPQHRAPQAAGMAPCGTRRAARRSARAGGRAPCLPVCLLGATHSPVHLVLGADVLSALWGCLSCLGRLQVLFRALLGARRGSA